MGFLAGLAAAGIALGFGELIEGMSETIPSLVVAIAELLVDYTPGDIIAASIENLGSSQKTVMLTGITITTLLLGGVFGEISARGRRRMGVGGFVAFGLIGGWATARNPFSPALGSWFVALLAAALGIATMLYLLSRAPVPAGERNELAAVDPSSSAASRRSFLTLAGGAGVTALGLIGLGRGARGKSAAETARESIEIPAATADGAEETTAGADTSGLFDDVAALDTIDEIPNIAPFLSPNEDFYRIDTAVVVPQVDPANWSLRFTGMVDNPFEITLDEILAMDLENRLITLSCVSNEVGGNLVGNAIWTGVPLSILLDRAGVQAGATQIVGRSVDDWTAGFPTPIAYDGRNALLAVGMNGEPLPVSHGFPARLVVAGLYGYVSAVKWIEEIHLTTWEDFDGYWVPRGWSKEGPMKTQSRIDVPRRGQPIVPGIPTPIAGIAWAPTRGIQAVEIQIDDGEWMTCNLADTLGDESWVQWWYDWTPTEGDHVIQVRATDGTGMTQSSERVAPRPNGAEGWDSVSLEIKT